MIDLPQLPNPVSSSPMPANSPFIETTTTKLSWVPTYKNRLYKQLQSKITTKVGKTGCINKELSKKRLLTENMALLISANKPLEDVFSETNHPKYLGFRKFRASMNTEVFCLKDPTWATQWWLTQICWTREKAASNYKAKLLTSKSKNMKRQAKGEAKAKTLLSSYLAS